MMNTKTPPKFEETPVLQFCHGYLSLTAKELQVVRWIRPVKARDRKEQGHQRANHLAEIDIGDEIHSLRIAVHIIGIYIPLDDNLLIGTCPKTAQIFGSTPTSSLDSGSFGTCFPHTWSNQLAPTNRYLDIT